MLFEETRLAGVFIIKLVPHTDERGFFARSFCKKEFEQRNLTSQFVQCNISYNRHKGTVRGMHYQIAPYSEVKIVTCQRGSIYDVVVDIRKDSTTYGQWLGVELSADNYQSLYIPDGFAHGFQTLSDESEVFYQMGNYFQPNAAQGIRWDDPTLGITWPHKVKLISENDRNLPGFVL